MRSLSGAGRRPDASLAQEQYRGRASRYDLELAPFEPVRAEAIRQLQLAPGDSVLDVGCGTGLSFGPLEHCIGRRGHITGVDPSPEMLEQARDRVARNHWANIELLSATAAAAPLQGKSDAALFHFTHDVLRDPAAIGHVLRHLKPGARVVAAGLQWAPPWMCVTNAFVALAAAYSVTSMEGLARPWDQLAQHLAGLQVRTAMMGGVYIASGRLKGQH